MPIATVPIATMPTAAVPVGFVLGDVGRALVRKRRLRLFG